MIDISLAGLAGAALGLVAAALVYGRLATEIERRVRAARAPDAEDRGTFTQQLALLRRGVLAFDILVFGGLGYWIGDRIGG
jgi:predicted DNA-binding transcriptional regulator